MLERAMNLAGDPARIASQIANLVNRLVVVQGLPPAEPESVRAAAEQLSSRLELALEISSATTAAEAAGLLERYPLLHLLQVANHEVDARARRARKLATDSARLGGLLDDPLPDVLDALKPIWPLFYSAEKLQPEQFRTTRQLEITDAQLDLIEAYIRFGEAAGISERNLPRKMPPASFPPDKPSLNCSVLLATLFARSRLALPAVLEPLPIESLGTLLDSLPESPPELKRLIEQWLEELVHPVPAATGRIASVLTRLLWGYLEVPFDRFDPRFVEGLWLVRGGTAPD
ncbi:MAG: hypothetical protein D6806_05080 [Deltaproteobacteria bacterium]|nr:MAG: hypothetical protein D6806_05080 [Deltaproteobacteria bacterium]